LLQHTFREQFGIGERTREKEVERFIALPDVPSSLRENVDAIRAVGNFAAHPIKDTNTGQLAPVEPGEAEWLLEVLEELFDFAFVAPARQKAKRTP
jgi:hypothetical protein